jgi:hypothetical protein
VVFYQFERAKKRKIIELGIVFLKKVVSLQKKEAWKNTP